MYYDSPSTQVPAGLEYKTNEFEPLRRAADLERTLILLEEAVAAAFAIEPCELRMPTRGHARIALARQVAMYLAHVTCTMGLSDVGTMFMRDRTTVAHACAVIELRRDEPDFDIALDHLEQIVTLLIRPRRYRRRHWRQRARHDRRQGL